MKKTAFILFAAALACAVAAMTTGCVSKRNTGLSPATQNAGLSMTNRVGVSIGNGQQVSGMMDKGSVLDSYAAVANAAIKGKQQVAIIALSHGADKQPNVKDDKQTEKTLQDVLAQGIAAAKSGGSNEAMAKAGIEIVKGLARLGTPTPEPAADNTSATVFALFAGDGANSAGVGAMAEGRMTRVEAIKAARANVDTISRDSYKETVSADGLKTMTALAKVQAEIEKAKIKASNSPAGVVAGSQKPGLPEAATPAPVPPPGDATGEPSDMTPAERAAAWYPSALMTDKPGAPASETALWKPAGEKTGKLAIHLPHSALGKILKVTVDDEADTIGQIGNGWRPLCRFSKPGGAYSGAVTVVSETGTWTAKNATPAKRANLDFKLAKPASELPPAVTPAEPTPEGEDAAAPGEPQAP